MLLFIRTLLLSLSIFLFHVIAAFMFGSGSTEVGYYNGLGAVIFYFFFGYWGYFILSGVYIYITIRDFERISRYLKGSFIVIMGYIVFRVPDLIDNDFVRNFDTRIFLIFLISIPVLVEIENLLRKKI